MVVIPLKTVQHKGGKNIYAGTYSGRNKWCREILSTNPYKTFTAALNAAKDGDTIKVVGNLVERPSSGATQIVMH